MDIFKDIECYSIVIKGDERSEYYYEYCKPSWERLGVTVNKFNAVTPSTLKREKELNFKPYSGATKYVRKGLKVEITPTEKACFYSHFKLWQHAAFSNKPIMILEHDSFLEKLENMWYDDKYGIIFYDAAAMGSYVIQPNFARDLILWLYSQKIDGGPYSYIYEFGLENKRSEDIVNDRHSLYNVASNQVMSRKYGNTIEHYSNGRSEFKQHNFIIID